MLEKGDIAVRAELARRESHLRALVELSTDWYWEQDAQFRFTRFSGNVEILAGSSVTSHIGKARWELPIVDDDSVDWQAHRALHKRHESFRNFEFARRNDDGEIVWLSASGQPLFDNDTGQCVGYLGTARNITRRKLAEAALQDSRRDLLEANRRLAGMNAELERLVAEREAELATETVRHAATQSALAQAQRVESIGQLAGGVAHDFNNLLAVIDGSLELIEPDLADRSMQELLGDARSAVASGVSLNNQLLSFARRRRLTPSCVSINERVTETARLLDRTLGEDIALRLRLDPDVKEAFVDPAEMDTALVNLAINARDAMPGGGTLTIKVCHYTADLEESDTSGLVPVGEQGVGEQVEIVVTDDGEGMAPDILAQAIDPFFTTKEPGRGTGLGLSSVYGFATQSGGSLSIESRVGQGTTVSLRLPKATSVRSKTDASSAEARSSNEGGELVLVIEDDPAVRRLTLRRFRSLGYETLDAASGIEAIQRLEAGASVALVFSDIVMPGGMSGHDVARWVRAHRPGVAVLLTSGYNDALRAGAHGSDSDVALLGKPYTLEDLARRVREALAMPEYTE